MNHDWWRETQTTLDITIIQRNKHQLANPHVIGEIIDIETIALHGTQTRQQTIKDVAGTARRTGLQFLTAHRMFHTDIETTSHVVGWLIYKPVAGIITIDYMRVHHDWQRCGIGRDMLYCLKSFQLPITASVTPRCSSQSFFNKCGFAYGRTTKYTTTMIWEP